MACSFSDANEVVSGSVGLFPVSFSLSGYQKVFGMVGVILKIGLLLGAAVLWPGGFWSGPLDPLPLAAAGLCLLLSLRRGAGPGLGLLACAVLGAAWTLFA